MTQQEKNTRENSGGIEAKREHCVSLLQTSKRVVVAFSAGVDSTFLLALAAETLGPENVLAAIGVSPSLANRELQEARQIARRLNVELVEVLTGEMDNPQYLSNPSYRCYFCKQDLFTRLTKLAQSRGFHAVLSGANADDAGDFRPGMKAGEDLGVRNPLMEANLSKSDIRELSRRMGLPTWDKPAMACLASRVPYGEVISAERLSRIERAEQAIRDLGFRQVRVRDHQTVARIEVPAKDLPRLLELRDCVSSALKQLGYVYIAMDLQGFRSGSANEAM